METQLELLSHSPIARRHDPVTSHEAAEKVTKSGSRATQQHAVLELVKSRPGNTSAELAVWGSNLGRHVIARRLPELREAGLVRNGEPTRCDVTGNRALSWWPV